MRNEANKDYFDAIFTSFAGRHQKHINEYGQDNDQRLTGDHETQRIDTFPYGVADRGVFYSSTNICGKSWLERILGRSTPSIKLDPYRVARLIVSCRRSKNQIDLY